MQPFDLSSGNAQYLEQLYEQYQLDPSALDPQWVVFFKGFEFGYLRAEEEEETGEGQALAAPPPPRAAPSAPARAPAQPPIAEAPPDQSPPTYLDRRKRERSDKGVYGLVQAYRQFGHYIAKIDPLGHNRHSHPLLELSEFGLGEADLEKGVDGGGFHGKAEGSLRDLIAQLQSTYCASIGVDFMAISDKSQLNWLEEKVEPTHNRYAFTPPQQRRILSQLIETEEFERFLHNRYVGQKRFSIEGCEVLNPLLDTLVEYGVELGVEEIVMGMSHRGRLNMLAHLLHKPYEIILSEFEGADQQDTQEGDVKYHQGYSYDHITRQGKKIHLSLSPNPSHLELVDPVIEGIVQAKQDYLHDLGRNRVVPLQIHGEAAFTGQGIVAETLNLSQLEGYRNGGTIHIIVNNQLGYTATPEETRFTSYPTDVARQIQAPVFHVNVDDPEAVVHAARLAIEFRQKFKRDVLIDLWCYRRHGHNEADDPTLTQPLMYQEIGRHPTVCEIYIKQLIAEDVVTQEESDEMREGVQQTLDRCQEKARRLQVKPRTSVFGGTWQGFSSAGEDWEIDTSVNPRTLLKIAQKTVQVPEGFIQHRTVKRIMEGRLAMGKGEKSVDWGGAEMFSFGSLLLERIPVRLAGQDSQRGTFAHRHAVWHDTKTGEHHKPLAHLDDNQAEFAVYNTMLSELAVLGFEYGISSADPRRLIIWEAQFGDFVNGAQLVIDQFLSSAEAKWQRMSGLVLLLPHGYEGMGPEHSSARLERFLQLCAKDNMQVCYPSEPSQIFHLFRRQMHRNFRKPLIVMSPKSLLRHPRCVSPLEAFTKGGFRSVIEDKDLAQPEQVRRIVLCTGKVYYDLLAGREEKKREEVALVRIEQLYPFPEQNLREVLASYPAVEQVFWVQEEASNMGAWSFVQPLLDEILNENMELRYVGRDEAASPAVGTHKTHQEEQQEIVDQALEPANEVVLADVQAEKADTGSG